MNRIGFTLLFLGTLLFFNTSCQNFFWSHRCCAEPDTTTTTYGYLYNWYAIIGDTDGDSISNTSIANTGWHVPTRAEWVTMETYLGGSTVAGGKMNEPSTDYWLSVFAGTDNSSGFNARGTGYRDYTTGEFFLIKERFHCWTSTTNVLGTRNWFFETRYNSLASNNSQLYNFPAGVAVRLVKDATTLSDGETGIYIGNNGKRYPTICIGTQEWLAHNLEETQYLNGEIIPLVGNDVSDNATWVSYGIGAYCIHVLD